jgi:hypothetical protein
MRCERLATELGVINHDALKIHQSPEVSENLVVSVSSLAGQCRGGSNIGVIFTHHLVMGKEIDLFEVLEDLSQSTFAALNSYRDTFNLRVSRGNILNKSFH